MRAELRLINALIGMTQGGGRWPTLLRDLGFRLTALQSSVGASSASPPGTVVPEAVFWSEQEDCIFPVESKSSTFADNQALRYLALSVEDLKEHGVIPSSATETAVVAPAYFCDRNNTPSLRDTIRWFNSNVRADLALIDYNHKRFELQCGRIRNTRLHDNFESGIYFDEAHWPTRFVPFDYESPDEEIVTPLARELVLLLLEPDIEEFSAEDLARGHPDTSSDGFISWYESFGADARKRWRRRIVRIVEELRVNYLQDVLSRKEREQAWRRRVTLDHPSRLRSIHARVEHYRSRKAEGLPLKRQTQHPPLFDQDMIEEDD